VPFPRRVLPTPQPLFWPEQNCRPGTIHSTAPAGVRSIRRETRARFPAKPLAPPSPAIAASTWRDAGIRPANPASEHRCAESTKCLPALCGRWPVAARPAGAGGASGAEAESFPTARRSTTDRIAASALPLALRFLSIAIGSTQLCQYQCLVPSFATGSSRVPHPCGFQACFFLTVFVRSLHAG